MPLVTIEGVFYLEDLNRQKDILREMANSVGSRFVDKYYDALVIEHGAYNVTLSAYRIIAEARWLKIQEREKERCSD